jgi:hypothetical protein
MDVQESQSNWPEMRKTLGKPGFCSMGFRELAERTGTEQLAKFLGIRNVRVLAMQIPVHFSKHLGI